MIQIFDSRGVLIENPDTTGLDANALALLATVTREYHATRAAEAALQAAITEQAASELAAKNTRDYCDAHYPPQSFHSLWLETFGTKEEQQKHAGRP
jgi:hypothetical protein